MNLSGNYPRDIDYGLKAHESFRIAHLAPAPPDYTADGLMDIVVSRGLEAMARIEWEMSQGPEHLRHNFKVINDSVPGDPVDGCEWSGGKRS